MLSLYRFMRQTVYLSLGTIDLYRRKANPLAVFCYHDIGEDNWRFSLGRREFLRQIDHLLKYASPVSLDNLWHGLKRGILPDKPAFAVTFDDGYAGLLSVADDLIKRQVRPTVFALSDPDGVVWPEMGQKRNLLKPADLRALHAAGWLIGSHGATHRDFSRLNQQGIVTELIESKIRLEEWLKKPVHYFAYPKGRYNNRILDTVKAANYRLGLTMDDGIIGYGTDPLRIPRVGIDRSHTFQEFKVAALPSNVRFRQLIKSRL